MQFIPRGLCGSGWWLVDLCVSHRSESPKGDLKGSSDIQNPPVLKILLRKIPPGPPFAKGSC